MSINYETIDFRNEECFRVLRWERDVSSVALFDSQQGTFLPMEGAGNQWHRHQEIEITLVQSGSGIRVVGDASSEIPLNSSLVILGGGLPHCWSFSGPSAGICVQWNAAKLLQQLTDTARLEVLALIESSSNGLELRSPMLADAEQILVRLANDASSSYTARFGLFLELLGALISTDSPSFQPISSTRFDGKIRHADYFEMQMAIGWILDNFQSEIRLQDLLDLVKMSKASFGRHFKKYTGQSYSQFVNDIRVSHACRLLHSSRATINAIALDSGFTNLSNFNRIFRKRKGLAPSEYRNSTVDEIEAPLRQLKAESRRSAEDGLKG